MQKDLRLIESSFVEVPAGLLDSFDASHPQYHNISFSIIQGVRNVSVQSEQVAELMKLEDFSIEADDEHHAGGQSVDVGLSVDAHNILELCLSEMLSPPFLPIAESDRRVT